MKKFIITVLTVFILFGCSKDSEYKKIKFGEAMDLVENNDALLIDVRSVEEYGALKIQDTINIPVDEIEYGIESYVDDKDRIIIVFCRSGNRSETAARKLIELGYTNVYDLGGLIQDMELEKE